MKIVLIETSDIGAQFSAEAVIRLGFEPLFLANLKNYQGDTLDELKNYPFIDCDTTSPEKMVRALVAHQVNDIEAVTTFLDSRLSLAVDVANLIGVKGLDRSLINLKDKTFARDLIPEFSPPTRAFRASQVPHAELKGMLTRFGKMILKPALTAGAIGVEIIDNDQDLNTALEGLGKSQIPQFLNNDTWLAQAFLEGPLFSAEGYVENLKPRFLGISDRKKIGKTESQINFPVDQSLSVEIRNQVHEAIQSLVERAQFQRGYFHIEFIVANQRPYIVDANMGRIGGGTVAVQVAMAFKLNPIVVFAHILDLSLNLNKLKAAPYISDSVIETSGFLYGAAREGVLHSIVLPELKACKHVQLLNNGTIVPAMGTNNWAWIGMLCGPTQAATEAMKQIKLWKENKNEDPVY